ncbi:MAG: SDR family NAD(P)-dependent oxidoreductase [Planctomycetota bacterium]
MTQSDNGASNPPTHPTEPIVIIGMGCLFPKAADLRAYWANIKNGVDAITDLPPGTHWRHEDYFSPDSKAQDRTVASRGGFLSPVDFDPLQFGVQPNILEATDTSQLLGMYAAVRALDDAGYGRSREFDRSRVSVVLGVTSALELVTTLSARLGHPKWRRALRDAGVDDAVAEDVIKRISESYVPWQENSFPGLLGNVVAGRISNHLDLKGTNCVVDAACASSLSALHLAVMELETRRSSMVVTGGVDTFSDIFMYTCFSKTFALSPTGDARPFDAGGDGTILGEGLGILVLKRLSDAERDGDRIYATIRGIGTSGDGKGNAIYAPSAQGQERALLAAYERAGVSTDTIELLEAHGTGTTVGDDVELTALTRVFRNASQRRWCAIGSVKSQIGHTKAGAGVAGLIKAVMALQHKVLPPSIKVTRPLEKLADPDSPFFLMNKPKPWLAKADHPRRAGVSSFGFGGSNYHCVLEEYDARKQAPDWAGDTEIPAFSADKPEGIRDAVDRFPWDASWEELLVEAARARARFDRRAGCRLVFVVHRNSDRKTLSARIRSMLEKQGQAHAWSLPEGVWFDTAEKPGQVGFVFPGQGAQYVGMGRDLSCLFPQFLEALASMDKAELPGKESSPPRISDAIYPCSAFDEETASAQEEHLRATRTAQPAIGAISLGAFDLLASFGIRPDAVAGHSYGEFVALHAAGVIDRETLCMLSRLRGELMTQDQDDRGSMLAVRSRLDKVEAVIREQGLDLVVANRNAPEQAVLSGRTGEIRKAEAIFIGLEIRCSILPVSAAFHSELVSDAAEPFLEAMKKVRFSKAEIPVYANTTGEPYPLGAANIRKLLAFQLARPVEFVRQIENMYAAGVRTFIEVGPGSRLSGLVKSILAEKDARVLTFDGSSGKRPGAQDLARVLAEMASLGYAVRLEAWNAGCVDLNKPLQKPKLVVSICGANYSTPREKRPPVTRSQAASSQTSMSQTSMTSPLVASPAHAPFAAPSAVSPALQKIHDGMMALQRLQEQTSLLHRQFLENQQAAARSISDLMMQQQGMAGASGSAAPLFSRDPAPMAAPSPAPGARQDLHAEAAREEGIPLPAAAQEITPAPDSAHIESLLLETIADKTGYPVEMLELDMSLDSDLGIDSIKRVEILSTLKEQLPEAPPIESKHLGDIQTLRHIVNHLAGGRETGAGAVTSRSAEPVSSAPAGGHAASDPSEIEGALLETIADKTGYPVDMLEIDMSLDSDLGIDSIKRVEILSALRERFPEAPAIESKHLGELQTLRHIVEHLSRAAAPATGAQAGPPGFIAAPASKESLVTEPRQNAGASAPLERMVLGFEPIDPGVPRETLTVSSEHPIWITDEDTGLAQKIAEKLKSRGFSQARVVPFPVAEDSVLPNPLAGLILLTPAKGVDDDFLRSAFLLVQKAEAGLREAGARGGALLATVSRLDGRFGLSGNGMGDPISGGLAGLAKTAGHEWPEVRCRALDLADDYPDPAGAAEALVEELFTEGPVEVGMSREGSWKLFLLSEPVPSGDPASKSAPIRPGDLVLVTGGARGVTAEAAKALARAFRPQLVLVGRSPVPFEEPAWLKGLHGEAEIKKAIIARSTEKLAPRQLEEAYRKYIANREMLKNIDGMNSSGAGVRYVSVDLRDAGAVAQMIADMRAEFGPVKGIVHGAGVLADRRISDKTREQFDQVYSTKVAGLRNLLAASAADDLSVLVLFSSSTGRFGRTGQVDYSMANEVLNKMAQQVSRDRAGCRAVSINWGPWDGGMVTPALKTVFEEEGIRLIDREAGSQYLIHEICAPAEGPKEVLLMGGPLPMGTAGVVAKKATQAQAPLLKPAFDLDVDIGRFPFLEGHVINNKAVLPVAVTLEWLGHAALHAFPGLRFHGVNDLKVFKGVTLDRNETFSLRFYAGAPREQDGLHLMPVEMRGALHGCEPLLLAGAEMVLAHALPQEESRIKGTGFKPYGSRDPYREFLFHGSDFQCLESVSEDGDAVFSATSRLAPLPAKWMKKTIRGAWLANPLALDAGFQLMILWSFRQHGMGSLPSRVGTYRQFRRSFPKNQVKVLLQVTEHTGSRGLARIEFLDPESNALIARITDYECIIDATLNRAFRRNRLSDASLNHVETPFE